MSDFAGFQDGQTFTFRRAPALDGPSLWVGLLVLSGLSGLLSILVLARARAVTTGTAIVLMFATGGVLLFGYALLQRPKPRTILLGAAHAEVRHGEKVLVRIAWDDVLVIRVTQRVPEPTERLPPTSFRIVGQSGHIAFDDSWPGYWTMKAAVSDRARTFGIRTEYDYQPANSAG